jgi:hypothetical protein
MSFRDVWTVDILKETAGGTWPLVSKLWEMFHEIFSSSMKTDCYFLVFIWEIHLTADHQHGSAFSDLKDGRLLNFCADRRLLHCFGRPWAVGVFPWIFLLFISIMYTEAWAKKGLPGQGCWTRFSSIFCWVLLEPQVMENYFSSTN